jgi:Domain of unknown function (DUF4184)
MPWIVPSHQAVVLPLKMFRPALFSGLALCLGSMAPDLEFLFRVYDDWAVSHTLAAQLYLTVPVVLALHWVLTTLILPWVVPLLPSGRPLHLEQLSALRPTANATEWCRIGISGMLGGSPMSGWAAVPFFPVLRAAVPFPGGAVLLHDA